MAWSHGHEKNVVNHQQVLMTKTTRETEMGLTKRLFEIQPGVAKTLKSRDR